MIGADSGDCKYGRLGFPPKFNDINFFALGKRIDESSHGDYEIKHSSEETRSIPIDSVSGFKF